MEQDAENLRKRDQLKRNLNDIFKLLKTFNPGSRQKAGQIKSQKDEADEEKDEADEEKEELMGPLGKTPFEVFNSIIGLVTETPAIEHMVYKLDGFDDRRPLISIEDQSNPDNNKEDQACRSLRRNPQLWAYKSRSGMDDMSAYTHEWQEAINAHKARHPSGAHLWEAVEAAFRGVEDTVLDDFGRPSLKWEIGGRIRSPYIRVVPDLVILNNYQRMFARYCRYDVKRMPRAGGLDIIDNIGFTLDDLYQGFCHTFTNIHQRNITPEHDLDMPASLPTTPAIQTTTDPDPDFGNLGELKILPFLKRIQRPLRQIMGRSRALECLHVIVGKIPANAVFSDFEEVKVGWAPGWRGEISPEWITLEPDFSSNEISKNDRKKIGYVKVVMDVLESEFEPYFHRLASFYIDHVRTPEAESEFDTWLDMGLGRSWLKTPRGTRWLGTEAANWWLSSTDAGISWSDTADGVAWLESDDAQKFLDSDFAIRWCLHGCEDKTEPPERKFFETSKGLEWKREACPMDEEGKYTLPPGERLRPRPENSEADPGAPPPPPPPRHWDEARNEMQDAPQDPDEPHRRGPAFCTVPKMYKFWRVKDSASRRTEAKGKGVAV